MPDPTPRKPSGLPRESGESFVQWLTRLEAARPEYPKPRAFGPNCPICGAPERASAAGRIEVVHDFARHNLSGPPRQEREPAPFRVERRALAFDR